MRAVVFAVAAALSATAYAVENDDLRGPRPGVASHPTPAFDGEGHLWLAFEQGDFVYVTSSDDRGRSFAPAVAVNLEPEPIDANGEGRPKIAVHPDGTILVTWTRKLEKPYTGLIRFSRSTDNGTTFSKPATVNDDGLETGHRFDALAVAPSGDVLVSWIDKRDLVGALANGEEYAGAAIYSAVSRDSGRTFEPNRKLTDHVCECCRLSFAFDSDGEAYLLFRDILHGSIRDHSLAKGVASESPEIRRVSFDEWKIDICPHHGPSLWIDDDDVQHVAWFSAGARSGTGTFYARSTDGGRTYSKPMGLGAENATHPFVIGIGARTFVVWMEASASGSVVKARASEDGGRSFGAEMKVATGAPGADHPLLVSDGGKVYLSWFTKNEGYRLIALRPVTE